MASPFVIGDLPGYSGDIARLVGMMTYTRQTTIDAVQGLSVDDLDHLHDARSNSIGALLMHIGAVELAYQVSTFEARDLSPEELAVWGAALDLGPGAHAAIRGASLDEYLRRLAAVRERTLAALAGRNDEWLYEEAPFWRGRPANNYFKWFHVFEDELNHRGQIRWLVKRLPR